MTEKRMRRSQNQMVGGVCAGIAEYFGWDPTLVRLAFALIVFITVGLPGLLVYLIFWIVMPGPVDV